MIMHCSWYCSFTAHGLHGRGAWACFCSTSFCSLSTTSFSVLLRVLGLNYVNAFVEREYLLCLTCLAACPLQAADQGTAHVDGVHSHGFGGRSGHVNGGQAPGDVGAVVRCGARSQHHVCGRARLAAGECLQWASWRDGKSGGVAPHLKSICTSGFTPPTIGASWPYVGRHLPRQGRNSPAVSGLCPHAQKRGSSGGLYLTS